MQLGLRDTNKTYFSDFLGFFVGDEVMLVGYFGPIGAKNSTKRPKKYKKSKEQVSFVSLRPSYMPND